jgi:hypothetical protein
MSQAEESLGMAMTFSIASAAREALLGVVFERLKQEQEEEDRKTREYEEVRPADVPSFGFALQNSNVD